jgi:predicted oxidoreductase
VTKVVGVFVRFRRFTDKLTEKHFLPAKSLEKITIYIKCGIQMVTENRKTVLNITSILKSTSFGLLRTLKNLQTDYLDVFLLHRPSPLMRADEIAEAVLKLQSDRKIIDF